MNKIKDQITTLLIEHVRVIYSVVSDMGVYYTDWAEDYEKNKENLNKKKHKMELSEEDGDEIKIRLIQEFSEMGTQGFQEYLNLILKMDNTINFALEFVDILAYMGSNAKIDKEIKKRYHRLINDIIKMADILKITIKNLRDQPQEVFKNTTTIHEIENRIDGIFREFLNYLYDNKDLNIGLLLRIRDSIKILEELADKIHDLADSIRILIYQ